MLKQATPFTPNQRDSCCPHYTLRLDAAQCHLTKDQRSAINRFNRYVLGDEYIKEASRLYPRSRDEAKQRDNQFNLVDRIHEAETQSLKANLQPAHTFSVSLEPDEFTEEKYAIFENYQRVVHHESPSDITRDGFKRFLCDSPLRRQLFRAPDGTERPLGSFHQCYRLDGKLVAVGVLDLLPHCVSAKYFLYHESIHRFQAGKLGALYEIALAEEKGYGWWYSGFYIHTCPKMRYKIDFKPQYVLDPDRHVWTALDKETLKLFDEKGYLHLSEASPEDSAVSSRNDSSMLDVSGEAAESLSEEKDDDDDGDDDEDEDDDDDLPLLRSNMPGLPSMDLIQQAPLDIIPVRLTQGFISAGDLFDWDNEEVDDPKTAKGMVAELVAAVGLELMLQWALDFRKS
ncbi:uncharacterized protein JN550_005983 [Neoarthrinium moseri]|uniref:uncharacterized protein n=1 Tax=Neoarthrinium moseri TaxID=1658444 RepID=UPI001FDADDA6|nr:uncharacterized protein JN550_005983 [Neoarthrinium moseri]KAI1869353.1 hypothetical protein JN550_005983 [Neoarthrinium moseri]